MFIFNSFHPLFIHIVITDNHSTCTVLTQYTVTPVLTRNNNLYSLICFRIYKMRL